MYQYQQTRRYFAQVAGGLEEAGKAELEALGAQQASVAYRGVYFDAGPAVIYGVNYRTRLLTRVLAPLVSFDCHSDKYLYKTAREIKWTDFLSNESTFAVFANVSNSRIRHSKYAAQRLKDAIVDDFRDRTGRRPDVDTRDPDLWLNLHIENNHATISLDTSGGSLHRRGYRKASLEAPMQETVAAAVLHFSDWEGASPLYDPMCGSGTLLCEALMRYTCLPGGFLRQKFGFERLPDYDESVWRKTKKEIDSQIRELPGMLIGGSDIDERAVETAHSNLARLPGGNTVNLTTLDFRRLAGLEGATIVCNPPYGVRMGKESELALLF
jgi:putative N6-adenine-specific DNA methylase